MGSGFDEREKGMEAKWAHDEDLRFRAIARRNKLLAQWAVAQMGLKDAEAEGYTQSLLDLEVRGAGDEDIVQKIHTDFAARSIAHSEHFIRTTMSALAVEATKQIMNETKA
jgi:hypothetical protein